jgi:hypothetical protein
VREYEAAKYDVLRLSAHRAETVAPLKTRLIDAVACSSASRASASRR